ncbi:MAG: hypothetical protein KDE56_03445 [Anaerolineales bacterium]|nr:hypothetical protein [Anaerolineales bacterium]
MSVTKQAIEQLLARLKQVRQTIEELMAQVQEQETVLLAVQAEYDDKLGALNGKGAELQVRAASLRALLEEREPDLDTSPSPPPIPPPPIGFVSDSRRAAAQAPVMSESKKRKRVLIDHIVLFTDDRGVIQTINVALVDEGQDIGHILERLVWGEIWEACSDWEEPADHKERLELWLGALEERLMVWQGRLAALAEDSRYGLWEEKRRRKEAGWLALLEELAAKQRGENARLVEEIAVLEADWQAKQEAGYEA